MSKLTFFDLIVQHGRDQLEMGVDVDLDEYEDIRKHPHKHAGYIINCWPDYIMYHAAGNPNITWKILNDNFNDFIDCFGKNFAYHGFSRNPNLTWNILYENIKRKGKMKSEWNWVAISAHNIITEDIVKQNRKLPWSIYGLCKNANMSFDFIIKMYDIKLYINCISYNPNITWDIIKRPELSNVNWNWKVLASNSNIVKPLMEAVLNGHMQKQEFLSHKWDPYYLSKNKCLTWDFVFMMLNKVDFDIYENNVWCWKEISRHSCVTWSIIKKYKNIKIHDKILKQISGWVWVDIALNPNIGWDHLMEIIDWNDINVSYILSDISLNRNINLRIIQKNHSGIKVEWDWVKIAANHMDGPFWYSQEYKKELCIKNTNIIHEELIKYALHPSRHPSYYLSSSELEFHPLNHHSPDEVYKMCPNMNHRLQKVDTIETHDIIIDD